LRAEPLNAPPLRTEPQRQFRPSRADALAHRAARHRGTPLLTSENSSTSQGNSSPSFWAVVAVCSSRLTGPTRPGYKDRREAAFGLEDNSLQLPWYVVHLRILKHDFRLINSEEPCGPVCKYLPSKHLLLCPTTSKVNHRRTTFLDALLTTHDLRYRSRLPLLSDEAICGPSSSSFCSFLSSPTRFSRHWTTSILVFTWL